MDNEKSVETRRGWIGSVSLLCIGAQFTLLVILSFINMGFVSADLPGREPPSELSWDQWIALFCYSWVGFPLLLTGLWVLGLFAWINSVKCDRVTVGQKRLVSSLLIPAWVLFVGLNGVLLLHYWNENSTELFEKVSIYFVGPAGAKLPAVSFLPWLVPLAILGGFGFSGEFRGSSGWGFQLMANLPIVLLVFLAEFHINFARPACEIINENESPMIGPTSADIVGFVTLGVLLMIALGLVFSQMRSSQGIRPMPQSV